MPFFSIIIPVYNVAAYLSDCIDSVLCQHCVDIEIILVYDCSSDGSGEICDCYAQKHSFIRAIHFETNRGVAAARNQGVTFAKGKYIIFIDSDDCLFSGSLDGVRKLIESSSGCDLIVCRYISENGVLSNGPLFEPAVIARDPEMLLRHITRLNYHLDHCWHFVLDRSFVLRNEIRFIDVLIAEDGEYITRALALCNSIAFYEGDFYWYRERDGSLKSSYGVAQSASFLKIATAMYQTAMNVSISDARRDFIISQTRHALGVFSARLVMHSVSDIPSFSSAITTDEFLSICRFLPLINIAAVVSAQGDISGALSAYKEALENSTISLVALSDASRIYIYCTGPIGEAVMQTLLDKGCAIEGVIDDNASLSGRTLCGKKIRTPSIFLTMTKEELSALLVIVCNQKKYAFEKIAGSLMELGIMRDQIVQRMF